MQVMDIRVLFREEEEERVLIPFVFKSLLQASPEEVRERDKETKTKTETGTETGTEIER